MSGLLRRLTRRRPATADENRSATAGSSEPAAAPADAPAEPGGDRPVPAADEQQTQVLPATGEQAAAEQPSPGAAWAKSAPDKPSDTGEQVTTAQSGDQPTAFAAQPAPVRDLPAGVDAGDLASAPADSARRGKLRRRLRYLRHVRELLLRDLGGFTYEVHRTAGGTPHEKHRRLSEAKANRISAIDTELGALEARLGESHAETVLREAGIGGTCPECGELHASDARFCSRCGEPLDAKARAQRQAVIAAAASAPTTGSHATAEPQPASVLWAGGPRPSAKRDEPEETEPPAPVTSEWLRRDQPTTFDRAAQPGEPAGEKAKPAAVEEPAKGDEPAAVEEAKPAAVEEPAKVDEAKPAEGDEVPKADEPAAAAQKPAAPSKPKRRPRKAAPKPSPEPEAAEEPAKFEPGPNGNRDEDVPPPITSGDPLASRREQRP